MDKSFTDESTPDKGHMAPKPASKISPAQIFTELLGKSLYSQVELDNINPNGEVRNLRLLKTKFDHYCSICKKITPWQSIVSSEVETQAKRENAAVALSVHHSGGPTIHNWMSPFEIRTQCQRGGHIATYHFIVQPDGLSLRQQSTPTPAWLIKVGQYPSLTDFQLGDLSEFESVMTKQQRNEFVRAINCSAHGFPVAACVYYRRVFEGILIDARNEHMSAHGMKEWPEFTSAHTDERIKLLEENLPKFLVDHPQLYGLLSLGIHELTEEQCSQQLPMLRQAIELILRDRVVVMAAKKQREAISKLIAQAVNQHMVNVPQSGRQGIS